MQGMSCLLLSPPFLNYSNMNNWFIASYIKQYTHDIPVISQKSLQCTPAFGWTPRACSPDASNNSHHISISDLQSTEMRPVFWMTSNGFLLSKDHTKKKFHQRDHPCSWVAIPVTFKMPHRQECHQACFDPNLGWLKERYSLQQRSSPLKIAPMDIPVPLKMDASNSNCWSSCKELPELPPTNFSQVKGSDDDQNYQYPQTSPIPSMGLPIPSMGSIS